MIRLVKEKNGNYIAPFKNGDYKVSKTGSRGFEIQTPKGISLAAKTLRAAKNEILKDRGEEIEEIVELEQSVPFKKINNDLHELEGVKEVKILAKRLKYKQWFIFADDKVIARAKTFHECKVKTVDYLNAQGVKLESRKYSKPSFPGFEDNVKNGLIKKMSEASFGIMSIDMDFDKLTGTLANMLLTGGIKLSELEEIAIKKSIEKFGVETVGKYVEKIAKKI